MTTMKPWTAAILALSLSACATYPVGPSVTALPGSGRTFDQFRFDDANCRAYAAQMTGSGTQQAANKGAIDSAAAGTMIGAAAGARRSVRAAACCLAARPARMPTRAPHRARRPTTIRLMCSACMATVIRYRCPQVLRRHRSRPYRAARGSPRVPPVTRHPGPRHRPATERGYRPTGCRDRCCSGRDRSPARSSKLAPARESPRATSGSA